MRDYINDNKGRTFSDREKLSEGKNTKRKKRLCPPVQELASDRLAPLAGNAAGNATQNVMRIVM